MPLRKIDEREKTDVGRSTDLRRRKKKAGPGGTARDPKKPVKPQPSPQMAQKPRRLKVDLLKGSIDKNLKKVEAEGGSPRLIQKGERMRRALNKSFGNVRRRSEYAFLTGGQAKLDKNNNNKIDAQDFKILKAEKAKGRGMGLQDEKMKPGKVMKARKGRKFFTARVTGDDDSFNKKMQLQKEGVIDKKTGAGRERLTKAVKSVKLGKKLLLPVAAGIGAVQYLKKKMKERKEEPKKKMGGGMMQRPMQYKAGTMIKARGGGIARSKPTKMY